MGMYTVYRQPHKEIYGFNIHVSYGTPNSWCFFIVTIISDSWIIIKLFITFLASKMHNKRLKRMSTLEYSKMNKNMEAH